MTFFQKKKRVDSLFETTRYRHTSVVIDTREINNRTRFDISNLVRLTRTNLRRHGGKGRGGVVEEGKEKMNFIPVYIEPPSPNTDRFGKNLHVILIQPNAVSGSNSF